MAKVTLDMETFKALASSTRLQLLRALDERRKTLSELSKELELNKATVHEHLQLLTATGLIKKRDDEGRKWIYYELTWQGERLLHPQETTTFAVLLGFSVFAAGGGVFMLGRALDWWWQEKQQLGGSPEGDAEDTEPEAQDFGAQQADRNGTSEPQPAASPSAAPPEEIGDGDAAASELDTGGGGFFDEGGWISLALLVTSILLAALAWTVRRSVKGRD